VNTLPWVKAHVDVDKLGDDDNAKRYSISMGGRSGYMLSVVKKLLEEIDVMKIRIKELEEVKE